MRVPLRAVLALVLLVGFFVLVLALTVGVAGVAVYALTTGHGVGGIKLGLLAGAVALAVGAAVRSVLRVKPQPYGAVVDRAAQPHLWAVVDELAATARTRGPDEIRLVPEVNAAVFEEAPLLGLREGRRYLMIGLPLLAGLTVSELRAVLAHELGHYSHGHTKLSALTYRATATVSRTVEEVDGVARWILKGYSKLYLLVARSANRQQELHADAASVAAAGREATRNALRRIGALAPAWSFYGDAYLSLAPAAGRTPDLLAGFRSFLADPHRQKALAEIETALLDAEPSSAFDSHPPIRKRIAAVDRLPDPGLPLDQRPAWSLLVDPERAIPAFEEQILIDGLGPRASWDEIVRLAGAEQAAHQARLLARAGTESGAAPAGTLGAVLDAVRRGDGHRLVGWVVKPDLTPEEFAEAVPAVLTDLLAAMVVSALIDAGRAHHELDWGGPWRVRLADGAELDPEEVVRDAATHPAAVPALRDRLVAMGVSLQYSPRPADD
ncbi:Zn-dependent protease with chaperone function [Streptoalloteichus tenebrarius]|uniref:Zn-dependent protease with chaperone function n=1 Tax=Streptoalloteichus tenebrarius (strain ATCC 17920 / DSM 40477 / JCM 4838 / CBS 697.72 / NBRC 16177 / NCIMB 11028 / NRRL B-12390 / A12253. 1 / ISP 5477) TaxID=1933 RepID=A0ABT1I2J2_STRSD|nr:M48 family metallopeptidase [Streptoalloteichus tenebrarius]MCP2261953.1 Zn-dependent protease with chaperone function [Streptoalloteichus tenebrarius]BFF01254.1 M48 family metallopeptidase [Streptoalloteichus tenebrarius]